MAHVRRQLRERVGVVLTGLSLTGSNVFESRLYQLNDTDLPCIIITTESEDVNVEAVGGGKGKNILRRSINLNVAIKAKVTANLDDVLDGIAVDVEKAIINDTNALLSNAIISNVEIDLNADGDQPIGTATLSWIFDIYTQADDPEIQL